MARTFTQIRQQTAIETGLFWVSGTSDSSGNEVALLQAAALVRYGNNQLAGGHILLTSGSPTFTELIATKSFQSDGTVIFRPELSVAPDSLTFEILPYAGTAFLYAIQDAINELYDNGYLMRTFWMQMMGGSPLYNADWSYWTGANAVDGWTASGTTITRERASANLANGETSVALTSSAGTLALDSQYQRYLNDYKGSNLTLCCWAKTSAASSARLNLNTGSDNFSTYHSGDGDWELLSVNVSTLGTDTALQPILVADTTTTAYFGMPFLRGLDGVPTTYPFPHQVMPDGPTAITISAMGIEEDTLAAGRGSGQLRQGGHKVAYLNSKFLKHHDENTSTQVGIIDFSESKRRPLDNQLMWLRGDGPLTIPSSALSTDILEVTESEGLLLAKVAAGKLLENQMAEAATSVRRRLQERLSVLNGEITELKLGVGESRDVATYSLGW